MKTYWNPPNLIFQMAGGIHVLAIRHATIKRTPIGHHPYFAGVERYAVDEVYRVKAAWE